jgi:hypothetical protein
MADTLSEDNFATTDSLWAPEHTWSIRLYLHVALHHIRMWGITKDGQGYHHLPLTPQPWDTRQTKVTCSLDNTSTLTITTLALAKNFRLYQESSTRSPATRMDDEPASK